MFAYGRMPYAGFSNQEVVEKVLSGYQMPAPDQCPPQVYAIMVKCWCFNPKGRPCFKDLFAEIQRLHEQILTVTGPPPRPHPESTMYANAPQSVPPSPASAYANSPQQAPPSPAALHANSP